MILRNALRPIALALVLAVSVIGVVPAQSMTVPIDTPFSSSNDQIFKKAPYADYSAVLGAGDTFLYLVYQVATSGKISFATGNENPGGADTDVLAVNLINTSTSTAASALTDPIILSEGSDLNNSLPNGVQYDAFFAAFGGLVSGTTYRLLVSVNVFDTNADWFGAATDLFDGQVSFNILPIPPAVLLLVCGLLGMGVLSRRPRRVHTSA